MKTAKWHLLYLTGETLKLLLQHRTTGATANGAGGDSMTETNGVFAASIAENLSGWFKAWALDEDDNPVAEGWINMSEATPVVVDTIATMSATRAVVGRYSDTEASSPNVTWKVGEVNKPQTVICEDENGSPIDLSEFDLTDAYIAIETLYGKRDVEVIEIADITVGGDDGNELTFQVGSAVVSGPNNYKWSFRQADETEIAHGRITVSYSPIRD